MPDDLVKEGTHTLPDGRSVRVRNYYEKRLDPGTGKALLHKEFAVQSHD